MTLDDRPARCDPATGDEKREPSALPRSTYSGCSTTAFCASTPDTSTIPDRDRFLLSKGHGPAAYYAGAGRARASSPRDWLDDHRRRRQPPR